MRSSLRLGPLLFAAALVTSASAAELIQFGDISVSSDDLLAAADRIGGSQRYNFLTDRRALGDAMDRLARVRATLAHGQIDQLLSADRQNEIGQRARDAMLGRAYLEHLIEAQLSQRDLLAEAREIYAASPDRFAVPETRDVTHLLIGTRDRSEQQAQAILVELQAKIAADPASFAELVKRHSDDPSVTKNSGRFRRVGRKQMVAEFEQAMFALAAVGEISAPVKTRFGYHLIRLDGVNVGGQRPFAEVRGELARQLQEAAEIEARDQLLAEHGNSWEQAAEAARAAGFEPSYLEAKQRFATEQALMQAYQEVYVEANLRGNFRQYAREYYLTHRKEFDRPLRASAAFYLLPIDADPALVADFRQLMTADGAVDPAQLAEGIQRNELVEAEVGKLPQAQRAALQQAHQQRQARAVAEDEFGYYVLDHIVFLPAGVPPFEEVETELVERIRSERGKALWLNHLAEFDNLSVAVDHAAIDHLVMEQQAIAESLHRARASTSNQP